MTNPTDHAPYAHEDARNRTTAIGDEDARELEHAEWLEAHPEVSAALPSWCDEVTLAPDDAEHVALAIGREVGPFSLSVEGDYCEGRFSLGLYEVHAARTRLCAGSAESVAASARARALELLTIAYVLESEGAR